MADSRRDRPNESAELVKELVEGLTALGTYLELADRALDPQLGPEILGGAIKKSVGQSKRVNEIARRLREILCDESADDDR